ncbi:hypothetical protein SAMN05421754_10554 [Nitrosomonas sp. Nm58]|nr:hypothetical protein SAMN05421754_10554 [Nitrosomonas sp. Nm58]
MFEYVADVVLEVFERRHFIVFLIDPALVPAGAGRDIEGVPVGGLVVE